MGACKTFLGKIKIITGNQRRLSAAENNKREVLYNGGEPRTFSYAEIVERINVGIFFGMGKELWNADYYDFKIKKRQPG